MGIYSYLSGRRGSRPGDGSGVVEQAYWPPVRPEDRIRAELALTLVAASTGVPTRRMDERGRLTGAICRSRRLAIYLAYITFEWPMERVAHAFGMNRTSAAKACRWVEDARDAPALDEMLDRLESCARQALLTNGRKGLPA